MACVTKQFKYIDQQTRDIVNNFSRDLERICCFLDDYHDIKDVILAYVDDHFMINHGTVEWNINQCDIHKLFQISDTKTPEDNSIIISSQIFRIATLQWEIKLFKKHDGLRLSLKCISKLSNDLWKGIEFLCSFECEEIKWKDRQIIWTDGILLECISNIRDISDMDINELTFIIKIKILQVRKWNNMSYENIVDRKLNEYDNKFHEIDRKFTKLLELTNIKDINDIGIDCKYENENIELLSEDKLLKFLVEDVKLSEYYDLFVMNGYDNILFLYDITKNDLHDIGITKIGHQNRIIHCIKGMKYRNDNMVPVKYNIYKADKYNIYFLIGYVIPIIMYILSLILKQIYLALCSMLLLFLVTIVIVHRVDDQCILPWIASPFGENKDKSINLIYLHLVFTILSVTCCTVYANNYANYIAFILGLFSYVAALMCAVFALYQQNVFHKRSKSLK